MVNPKTFNARMRGINSSNRYTDTPFPKGNPTPLHKNNRNPYYRPPPRKGKIAGLGGLILG